MATTSLDPRLFSTPSAAQPSAGPAAAQATSGKALRAGLWAAQGILAAAFLAAGLTKLTLPIEKLQAMLPWVNGAMGGAVRFIGVAELLGAVGLLLPSLTRIRPMLTPLAALGLGVVMLLAAFTHGARGELPMIAVNATLGALALFVAWGRTRRAVIQSR